MGSFHLIESCYSTLRCQQHAAFELYRAKGILLPATGLFLQCNETACVSFDLAYVNIVVNQTLCEASWQLLRPLSILLQWHLTQGSFVLACNKRIQIQVLKTVVMCLSHVRLPVWLVSEFNSRNRTFHIKIGAVFYYLVKWVLSWPVFMLHNVVIGRWFLNCIWKLFY